MNITSCINTKRKKYNCAILKWLLTGSINPQDRRFWRTYPQHAERATRRAIELVTVILQKADRSNTLIIVTSDHGELLGDDGAGHIYSLKDGNTRVPLYVKYPEGWKKKKQKTYIPLTDIPKILDPSTDTIGSDLAIVETFGVYRFTQSVIVNFSDFSSPRSVARSNHKKSC